MPTHADFGELPKVRPLLRPRAQRFPIRTKLAFRASGETAWRQGDTVNISRTGVLFRAGKPIEPKTMLQMRIHFPGEMTGDAPANVVCWGPVVRADGADLAAAILKFRFASA